MTAKRVEARKRVAVWIRVSTEDQVRGESPETHEARARAYADFKDWNVVEIYRLDAVSGKTVKDHPEAKRMLADVRRGHVSGLIFSKLARLARNTKELLEFAEIFRECQADLISLAEAIDTSSPAGRLFYTIIAAMAQWEREEIAARVAASVPIRAKMGKSLGGAAPFGYQWKDKKLIVDPKESPVLKLMFELFAEHKRKRTVARLLNERGLRTRNRSLFSYTTVGRLLRDSAAKGDRVTNRTKSAGAGKRWTLKPEHEHVRQPVEPVVSVELWDAVNAILDGGKDTRKRATRTTVHLFSGLTFCECGTKMYVLSNSPKYTCGKCRNKIPAADLEQVFHEQLRGHLCSPEAIAHHRESGSAKIAEKTELLAVLDQERGKLIAESDKLYALYQDGAIDTHGFGSRNRPLAERLKQLDDELPRVQAEVDVLRISLHSQEIVLAEARDLFARWPQLPQQEKRSVVEAITEKIIVGKGDRVGITLLFDPPTSATPGSSSGNGPQSWNPGADCKREPHGHGFIAAIS